MITISSRINHFFTLKMFGPPLWLLLAFIQNSHAIENQNEAGNPEIEGIFSVCVKDEYGGAKYSHFLKPPYNCGNVLQKYPLAIRSSEEYRERFIKAQKQIHLESRHEKDEIKGNCLLFAATCISRNESLSEEEKQKAQKKLFEDIIFK